MDEPSLDGVRQLIVWIPILDADERTAADKASTLFDRAAPPQFWDGTQLLGKEVGRSLGVPTWVAWDVYLFYGPEAEWTDAGLPAPAAAMAQAGGAVIAAVGTLPARGDQSRLPAGLEGRAVVAGSTDELPTLLAKVARTSSR